MCPVREGTVDFPRVGCHTADVPVSSHPISCPGIHPHQNTRTKLSRHLYKFSEHGLQPAPHGALESIQAPTSHLEHWAVRICGFIVSLIAFSPRPSHRTRNEEPVASLEPKAFPPSFRLSYVYKFHLVQPHSILRPGLCGDSCCSARAGVSSS